MSAELAGPLPPASGPDEEGGPAPLAPVAEAPARAAANTVAGPVPVEVARAEAAARRLDALSDRLGYTFTDRARLELAVTHRSFCAEHAGHHSNERLEFLGDAVLGIVVTDHIFAAYGEMPEGELAKLRASVVSAATLAEVADELAVGDALRLGKGEAASGGAHKPSILADAMEAILGAVYLDGGFEGARPLVLRLLGTRIAVAADGPGGHDFKTQLQELAARHFEQLPTYALRDEGPDHEKHFYATVYVGGEERGQGEGRSKKQAEQAAARAAWLGLVADLVADLATPVTPTTVAAGPAEPADPLDRVHPVEPVAPAAPAAIPLRGSENDA